MDPWFSVFMPILLIDDLRLNSSFIKYSEYLIIRLLGKTVLNDRSRIRFKVE